MSPTLPPELRDFARESGYAPIPCPDCGAASPASVRPCGNCGGSGRLWTSPRGSLADDGLLRLHHMRRPHAIGDR